MWKIKTLSITGFRKVKFLKKRVKLQGQIHKIFVYLVHSWSLNSEGSLACNTYSDMGHLIMMVPRHSQLLPIGWQSWVYREWDSITQPSACEVYALTDCASEAVIQKMLVYPEISYLWNTLVKYQSPSFHSSKFSSKVKLSDRFKEWQTGQKQYASRSLISGA